MHTVQYIDIIDKTRLTTTPNGLTNMKRGQSYSVIDSIPVIVHPVYKKRYDAQYKTNLSKILHYNKHTQEALSPGYIISKLPNERQHLLKNLRIKNGDLILFIGIGTGEDLSYLAKEINTRKTIIVGTGISLDVLKECYTRLNTLIIKADLVNCCPEALPFENNNFDAIAIIGSFNFIIDKAQAIKEAIRVARPGAHILIADETNKGAEKRLSKNKFLKARGEVIIPTALLPKEIQDIQSELTEDENYFVVSFKK